MAAMAFQTWRFHSFQMPTAKDTEETAIHLFNPTAALAALYCSLGLGAILGSGELAVTGGGAPRVHPAAREEEAERVAGHGGEQHAAVEGHDGQHDQVRRPHPGGVRRREQRGRGRRDARVAAPAARDAARGRGERLGERGEREHEEEAERVGAPAARARPPREQNSTTVRSPQKKVMCIIDMPAPAGAAWPAPCSSGAIAIGPMPPPAMGGLVGLALAQRTDLSL